MTGFRIIRRVGWGRVGGGGMSVKVFPERNNQKLKALADCVYVWCIPMGVGSREMEEEKGRHVLRASISLCFPTAVMWPPSSHTLLVVMDWALRTPGLKQTPH